MVSRQTPVDAPQPSLDTPWALAWQPEFVGTLMFIVRDGHVLLIRKKTGHGAGRINGPGGKVAPRERIVDCAVREVQEEVGLSVAQEDVQFALELRFVELDGPQWLGFAFVANRYSGQPTPSREADPFWCALAAIPYDRMWPDDAIWLPTVLGQAQGASRKQPSAANFFFAQVNFWTSNLAVRKLQVCC